MRYNAALLPASRQLEPLTALGLWAALCLVGAVNALWLGYGGRNFAATLTAFAFYFGAMLLFTARGVPEFTSSRFGAGTGYLLGTAAFCAYLVYAIGTSSFSFPRAIAAVILAFGPLLLAASAEGKAPGSWQDYLTLAGVWVSVKSSQWPALHFSLAKWLWPYPGGRLSYVFTVLFCVSVAIATFLLVRRLSGSGYNIGWGQRWSLYIFGSFALFAAIAIPLGIYLHFIQFGPRWAEWKSFPGLLLAILFFTAWPEELLFRGLLQNLLTHSCKSESAGWLIASVLFGFSHITNMGFPNWRYVLLASIAGLFYGWTWRKTGSIFASAIVHALVDALWHFLFRVV